MLRVSGAAAAIIGLLYLWLFTNVFTVVKYNIIFRNNMEVFTESVNSFSETDDTWSIYVKEDNTEKYEDLKNIGVELVIFRENDGIYFQLWSNRKVGRGIVYNIGNITKKGIMDWSYQIMDEWYVYQEH